MQGSFDQSAIIHLASTEAVKRERDSGCVKIIQTVMNLVGGFAYLYQSRHGGIGKDVHNTVF
jgi:hypothetical protein